MAGEQRSRLKDRLEKLVTGPIVGAVLVRRDGLAVASAFRRPLHEEVLSAMSAAAMAAAETALNQQGGPTKRLVAEGDRLKLIVLSVSDELLLVAVADHQQRVEAVLPALEAAVTGLTELVR